ncbi:MAG TPA: dolichyl-phosphate beta-glucosyltransferase [Patescibacteria group bacterium]|nr:dolichyl-phosphate beta-glucosyltransferase [Patescibacteria group bacterium]
MRLSVIIPVYNEEKRLPKTLKDIDGYLSKQPYDYEILVVDNGSTDKTVQFVKDSAERIRGLKLIEGSSKRGKGFAVKKGMLASQGDFRIFVDADNSTSLDQIEKMWPEFEKGCDIAIGSRDVKGAVLDPPQPWLRDMVLGEGFKLYRKLIIGLWGIQDTQCGFKCFTKKAAEEIFPKCKIEDFAFDPEILVIAKKHGYKIKEIPVHWKNDLESKVNFKSILNMALDLIRIKLNLIKGMYD